MHGDLSKITAGRAVLIKTVCVQLINKVIHAGVIIICQSKKLRYKYDPFKVKSSPEVRQPMCMYKVYFISFVFMHCGNCWFGPNELELVKHGQTKKCTERWCIVNIYCTTVVAILHPRALFTIRPGFYISSFLLAQKKIHIFRASNLHHAQILQK